MNALPVGEVKCYREQDRRPSCKYSFAKRIALNERQAPQGEGGKIKVLQKDAIWSADFVGEVGQHFSMRQD